MLTIEEVALKMGYVGVSRSTLNTIKMTLKLFGVRGTAHKNPGPGAPSFIYHDKDINELIEWRNRFVKRYVEGSKLCR